MNFIRQLLVMAAFLVSLPGSRAASEVVVAIRYLEAKGVSHAHLYLYKQDGALLRQLTLDESGQDRDPIFAPGGETIVFSRDTEKGSEIWSIEPHGGGLHRLPAAPGWYQATRTSPYFSDQDSDQGQDEKPSKKGDVSGAGNRTADGSSQDPRYTAPDHSVELILHESKTDEDDEFDGAGHGRHYRLKDLRTGKEMEFGKLPGFYGVYELLHTREGDRTFLLDPPLRAAFFGLHLNSTDGDTSFALDLAGRRFVRLSPNWAAPVPLPGDAAFLTLTYVRYVPIGGSSKTANCSYLERWDSAFQKVRYSREGAAICYGASMYRPGKKPSIVSLRKSGD